MRWVRKNGVVQYGGLRDDYDDFVSFLSFVCFELLYCKFWL